MVLHSLTGDSQAINWSVDRYSSDRYCEYRIELIQGNGLRAAKLCTDEKLWNEIRYHDNIGTKGTGSWFGYKVENIFNSGVDP